MFKNPVVLRILSSIILLVGVAILLRTILHLWNSFLPDFNVFYYSTFDLLHQHNPYFDKNLYTADNYPIFTNIFYFPYLIFSFPIAEKIYLFLNLICFISIIYIGNILTGKNSLMWFSVFFFFGALFFPLKFTLGMGQSNLTAYAFLLLSFYFYQRQKDILPGVLFSVAVLLKPILIFCILFFIIKQSWRMILSVAISSGVIILLSVLLFGDKLYVYYITSLVPHLIGYTGREVYYNQGDAGFISRAIANLQTRQLLSLVLSAFLVLGTLTITYIKKIDENWQFSSFLVTLLLIDSLSWQHHFVFLLFPLMYIMRKLVIQQKNYSAIALVILAYILTMVNIKNPDHFASTWYSAVILSHGFFGAIILWIILLAFWRKLAVLKVYGKTKNI